MFRTVLHAFISGICLLAFSLPSFGQANNSCTYTVKMHDSFGDGWNNGQLSIVSGTTINLFNLPIGYEGEAQFTVNNGEAMVASWTAGFYDQEVSFEVFDVEGNAVIAEDPAPAAGDFWTGTAQCPSCYKPTDVHIVKLVDTYVKLAWTPPTQGGTPLGYQVIYGPKGFVLGAAGIGDTLATAQPKVTINGLTEMTEYDVYIMTNCDSGDASFPLGPFTFKTYWSDDVGISMVVSPKSACDLGVEEVKIIMTNYGSNPQSLIPFRYSVNGVDAGVQIPNDGFYTGVLGKDSSELLVFETLYDFSAPGEYKIAVWTEMGNDDQPDNDTVFYYIVNRLVAPYIQDFETWSGGWQVDTSISELSSWAFGNPTTHGAASGVNAWATNLTGNYNGGEFSYLNSPCFDFSDLTEDPIFEFSLFFATEPNYDGAFVEMSLNDGQTWSKLGAIGDGVNWYNFNNTFLSLGDVWQGNSGGWVTARHILPGVAGNPSVRLRFVFAADFAVSYDGIGVDDIHIYLPLAKDLSAISATTLGNSDECGLAVDNVTFTLNNFGTQPQSFFDVAYSINGGPAVVENIGATIVAPGATFAYTFTTPFDSRSGLFNIKCWSSLAGELDPTNDSTSYTVDHRPLPVPFFENFESNAVPPGWTVEGGTNSGHGAPSVVLAVNLWSSNAAANQDLPVYGVISAGDTLSFDYRVVNYSSPNAATTLSATTSFEIQVSDDCGGSYFTIYTINSANHIPSQAMQNVRLSLEDYAGMSIKIRFKGTWGAGDFWWDLDNINLRACAADFGLTADVTPATPGSSDGSATVNVGLGNPPYTYLWSDGSTGNTIDNIGEGDVSVTVTDDLGCSDMLVVHIGSTAASEPEAIASFSAYPNPTTGLLQLKSVFNKQASGVVRVYNIVGAEVFRTEFSNKGILELPVDLSALPEGLYLVRLDAAGSMVSKKIVKE